MHMAPISTNVFKCMPFNPPRDRSVSTPAVPTTSDSVAPWRGPLACCVEIHLDILSAPSNNQHAIPIRIESIPLLDRMPVGRQRQVRAGEGAHQQQQAGARQMEIGEYSPDSAELGQLGLWVG